MRKGTIRIYKANGDVETYSRAKLYNSLKRTGLSNREASLITNKVGNEVCEGCKTRDIYHKTLKLVKERSSVAAVNYSLKRSLFDLGPTGYHFEQFVGRYFEELGFEIETCLTLQGRWVKHEVDVVAKKNGKRYFAECKFHNRKGIKNDIKTALYVKARWDDLREGPEGQNLHGFYLTSNTAFTLDAVTYAEGCGLKLLGVNAPVHESFLDQIKRLHLYPVTSLRRLNKHQKRILLDQKILVAIDLPQHLNALLKLGLTDQEIESILAEIELLKESKV